MTVKAGDFARRVGGAVGIAPEGVTLACAVLAAGALALALGWQWAGLIAILCGFAIAAFFRDPERAYSNMFEALAPGGLAVHSFATLYALPFVLNRVLPDRVSDFLFDRFSPRNRDRHDKFKAYYSHCRGPMESQLQFFRNLGYDIVEYRAYFGHNYYAPRLPLLHRVHRQTTKLLLKARIAFFVSYATVILRRPLAKQKAA